MAFPPKEITSHSSATPTRSQNVCHWILRYAHHQAPKLAVIRYRLSTSGLPEKSRGNGSLSQQKRGRHRAHLKKKKKPKQNQNPLTDRHFPSGCTYFPLTRSRRAALGAGRGSAGAGGWFVCVWRPTRQRSHPGTGRRSARQNAATAARSLSRRSAAPAPPSNGHWRRATEAVPAHARGGSESLTTGRVGRAAAHAQQGGAGWRRPAVPRAAAVRSRGVGGLPPWSRERQRRRRRSGFL